jgi:hypothetical protein
MEKKSKEEPQMLELKKVYEGLENLPKQEPK